MKLKLFITQCVLLSLVLGRPAYAGSPDGFWQDASPKNEGKATSALTKTIQGFPYRAQVTNLEQLAGFLSGAPDDGSASGLPFYFPAPTGGYFKLEVFRSSVMAPELEKKYPALKTYKVYGTDGVDVTGRMGFSIDGFYGFLHTENGLVSLEPESLFVETKSVSDYRVFYKKDGPSSLRVIPGYEPRSLDYEVILNQNTALEPTVARRTSTAYSRGDQLRIFRLAMAMTGELTKELGGTKEQGMAFIVKAVNLLNQVYEQELAIQLQLIANNDELIYTDPNTDPFSASNISSENVLNTNNVIGTDNYDIGHVLSDGGGGVAIVQAVCNRDYKASATSGFGGGNQYWELSVVDVLAHEVGHQFGAMHTQNSACYRSDVSSWEPHSGSTIMSYAGVCEPNLQNHADSMFHAGSRQEILDFLDRVSCGTVINTNNTPPSVDAGNDYTIPAGTPFLLTASTDSDQALTYSWDQMDLGEQTSSDESSWFDHGNGPLFRSFAPSSEPVRSFPKASAVLADDLSSSFGEILPTTDRTLNFRLTARSSQGLAQDDVTLTVDADAGPFKITAPTTNQFSAGAAVNIRWDVANTDQAPINCSQVDIDLSLDNGLSFEIALARKTANDGSEQVTLPGNVTNKVRFRVKCSNNIFYAISRFEPAADEPGTGKIYLVTGLEDQNNRFFEGSQGTTALPIVIRREYANEALSVDYSMYVDGEFSGMPPADADDFAGGRFGGSVTFQVGEFEATVVLQINADQVPEKTEYFFILLSNASSGTLSTNYALLQILDDDGSGENQDDDDTDTGDSGSDSGANDNNNNNNNNNDTDNSGTDTDDSSADSNSETDSPNVPDGFGNSSGMDMGGAFAVYLLLPLLLIRRRRKS